MDKITSLTMSLALGLMIGYYFGTKDVKLVVAIGWGLIFVAASIKIWLSAHGQNRKALPPKPGKGTPE
jgi:hypothetical protein